MVETRSRVEKVESQKPRVVSSRMAPCAKRGHSRESGNPACRQRISEGLRSRFPLSRAGLGHDRDMPHPANETTTKILVGLPKSVQGVRPYGKVI